MHRLLVILLWIIFVIASFGGSLLYLISKLVRFAPKLFV